MSLAERIARHHLLATSILPSLGHIGGFALRVTGYLDDVWPFHVDDGVDKLEMAARAIIKIKKEKPGTWDDLQNLHPKEAADVIVSIMLDDRGTYRNLKAAALKYPEVVKGLVTELKKPRYHEVKLKSARGNKLVLTTTLNAQVDRVEITGLDGVKAQIKIFMKNGDSGWYWDAYRKPLKFHEDYNELHLDRFPDPNTQQEKFAGSVESLFKTIASGIQHAGWVFDEVTKRVIPLAEWQEAQAKKKTEAIDDAAKEKLLEDLLHQGKTALAKILLDNGFNRPLSMERSSKTKLSGVVFGWYAAGSYLHLVVTLGNLNVRVEARFKDDVIMNEEEPREKAETILKKGIASLESKINEAAKERDAQLSQMESEETWSVVQLGMNHGYATEVETYSSKSKAIDAAKDAGGAYVLRGTQMWNEPLGQIEESDRPARTQWVKG